MIIENFKIYADIICKNNELIENNKNYQENELKEKIDLLMKKTNRLLINMIYDGSLMNFPSISVHNPNCNLSYILKRFEIIDDEVYLNLISNNDEKISLKHNNYTISDLLYFTALIKNAKNYNFS